MQSGRSREGFSGRLQNFPLVDIIQMACLAQRTGHLEVQSGKQEGRIFLARGRIVHAETRGDVGEGALLAVLCWKAGQFAFIDSSAPCAKQTLQGSWEHVLMEAIRRRDEREHDDHPAATGSEKLALMRRLALEDLRKEAVARRRRQRQKRRSRRWLLAGTCAVLLLAGGATALVNRRAVSTAWNRLRIKVLSTVAAGRYWQPRDLPDVAVPAGKFVFGDGQVRSTRAFRIDATEVTVWQYALFLDEVGDRTDYDHVNQPSAKGHRNPDWDALRRAAFSFSKFHGRIVTPNVPAVFLDWFDAYAYARWRGRRLPTEEEWEKSGRGPNGLRYPWGNAPQPDAANTLKGDGEIAGPSGVAEWKTDCSPYGVYDMAGNVSEWTASFDASGEPIVKGGNYGNESADLSRRVLEPSPLSRDARIGFRTAADAGPSPGQPATGGL